MIVAKLGDHPIDLLNPADQEDAKFQAGWAMFYATGNLATSALLTVLEPGGRIPTHSDSAEEIILVLEGTIEAQVGDEKTTLEAGMMGVNPALELHSMVNVGTTTSRVVGFMASNAIVSEFPEAAIMPLNSKVIGTPPPEAAAQLGYKKP
ncbi:MAG TPA: cupin domain-containing protein [Actinomycetota bacterium]|nr:cupin domain-containing protein [Actinomycetota bacterium]